MRYTASPLSFHEVRQVIYPRVFSGSRYDIGRIKGQRIVNLRLAAPSASDLRFAESCRRCIEEYHPAILDEFTGLTDACSLPTDSLVSTYFGRTGRAPGGCTNFAVTAEGTADDTTIVGRNYDWDYVDRRWCEARSIKPDGERGCVGYTHHWSGLCDGMNDVGLTICIASLPADEFHIGLQWHIVVDLVLASCTTAYEAADLLCEVPHVRQMSYLVADETDARAVQVSGGTATVLLPENGVLVVTNHRVENKQTSESAECFQRSFRRRNRIRELLDPLSGRISVDDLKNALSDHVAPVCVGSHEETETGSGTIWSLLAVPAWREVFVAEGHPCTGEFQKIDTGMIGAD